MLPGGTPAQAAYLETRQAFVVGNFLSVVLLSQCLLENVPAAHVGIEALSAEIHRREFVAPTEKPTFRRTIEDRDPLNALRVERLRPDSPAPSDGAGAPASGCRHPGPHLDPRA